MTPSIGGRPEFPKLPKRPREAEPQPEASAAKRPKSEADPQGTPASPRAETANPSRTGSLRREGPPTRPAYRPREIEDVYGDRRENYEYAWLKMQLQMQMPNALEAYDRADASSVDNASVQSRHIRDRIKGNGEDSLPVLRDMYRGPDIRSQGGLSEVSLAGRSRPGTPDPGSPRPKPQALNPDTLWRNDINLSLQKPYVSDDVDRVVDTVRGSLLRSMGIELTPEAERKLMADLLNPAFARVAKWEKGLDP